MVNRKAAIITHDKRAYAIYIYVKGIRPHKVEWTKELSECGLDNDPVSINLDFDDNDDIIGIEILY